MARIIPNGAGVAVAKGLHPGEAETLMILLKGLGNDYTVFHSVHWTRSTKKSTAFGEIDFVVVNRSGDILVIEQKNGSLLETDEGLVKRYSHKDKNLHSQIGQTIHTIRQKFSDQRREQGLGVDYLLYCPDYRVRNINSAMLDASRIVDAKNKSRLCQIIQELLGPGSDMNSAKRRDVESFFAQAYQLVPDIGTAITAGEKAYTQLSTGLQDIVRNLDLKPFRLRIQGVAGCGKTQVALEFLGQSSEAEPTLYVCFNRHLCDQMASNVSEDAAGIKITTFHELCVAAREKARNPVDFTKQKDNPNFWGEVVESVIALDIDKSEQFKRLVVDEGQDFSQEWWEVLRLFVADDYELLWFEDPLQNLRATQPVDVPVIATYRANITFRSPPTIADFIAETHGIEYQSAMTVPGLGVGVYPYDSSTEQAKLLTTRVNELRSQGFANEDIAVLTCKGLEKSELYELDKIAGVNVRKFTLEYDENHKPIYTDGSILFDSVFRFKGAQAPCVILVDVDPPDWRVESGRPVIFCGMTRATVCLEMLVNQDNGHTHVYMDS